jgi:hypothetical protein
MKHETRSEGSAVEHEPRVVRHTNLLLVVAAFAVAAGFLLPLPSCIFDVLLIFSTSMTAAALIITFSAQHASQVQGFPWLIVLVTTLRVALSVASAKLIFLQGHAGTIVELAGTLLVRDSHSLTMMIFSVLTVIIFLIICKSAGDINRIGTELASNIVAAGQIGVDRKSGACLIDNEQVFIMQDDMAREAGFFTGMAGAARFLLCAAVIELAVISFNTVNGLAAGSAAMNPTISVNRYVVLSTGVGMIIQLSSLLMAVASRCLMLKTCAAVWADEQSKRQASRRIKVGAAQAAGPGPAESPDESVSNDCERAQHIEAEFIEISNAAESITAKTFEPSVQAVTDEPGKQSPEPDENHDLNSTGVSYESGECYEALVALIESEFAGQVGPVKTILIGAENAAGLPVTIPVNIAMRLAQNDQRCLLIDLDPQRNAIAKVFDMDMGNSRSEEAEGGSGCDEKHFGIATCVDNVSVLPAYSPRNSIGDPGAWDMRQMLSALESRYDRTILYAPNIGCDGDRLSNYEKMAGCVQIALLFSGDDDVSETEDSRLGRFRKLLESWGCKVHNPAETLMASI